MREAWERFSVEPTKREGEKVLFLADCKRGRNRLQSSLLQKREKWFSVEPKTKQGLMKNVSVEQTAREDEKGLSRADCKRGRIGL